MRYHYKTPSLYTSMYGEIYVCDHPVYNRCTLFKVGGNGLAVIQQRFNYKDKSTWWGEIDPWLDDALYLNPGFLKYFNTHSDVCHEGLYPTVTIRQIMWALKMKPLPKERWETVFDHKEI